MRPYGRSIYLLDPREYSPELIAVAFAKTSRSPESFRELPELNDDTSARFMKVGGWIWPCICG